MFMKPLRIEPSIHKLLESKRDFNPNLTPTIAVVLPTHHFVSYDCPSCKANDVHRNHVHRVCVSIARIHVAQDKADSS